MSTEHNPTAGRRLTLAEWACIIDRSPATITRIWAQRDDFPAPTGRRPRPGPGPGTAEYDPADLDAWLRDHGPDRPHRYTVPAAEVDDMLTLGAIAARLGLNGRSITQYRDLIETHTTPERHGTRKYYRYGAVIDALNTRRGMGARPHQPPQ